MSRYLTLIVLFLVIYALVDLGRSPREQVRGLPKLLWVPIIVLLGLIGVGLWFLLGRPRATYPPGPGPGGGFGGPGGGRGPKPGPLAPDDDPEFLRQIDERSWRAKMEQLRQERQAGGTTGSDGPEPESPK